MGVEVSNKCKLYILLPTKIKDEFEIRNLHPNIIQVHLPRQKSRRWCIIVFENKEKLEEALIVLKKIKINEKSIKIRPYRGSKSRREQITKITKTKSASKEPKSTKPLLKLLKKNIKKK